MIIIQPLKFHYYSYRKVYISFWLVLLAITAVITHFIKIANLHHLFLISLAASFIFTILLSIYEYHRLVYDYIHLKIYHTEFYFSSIIYAFLHAFIQLVGIVLIYFILKSNDPNNLFVLPYKEAALYFICFFTHILLFALFNLLTILLRAIQYIKFILYTILLVAISISFFEIVNFVTNNFFHFLNDLVLIYKVVILEFILSIIILVLLYFKFLKFKSMKK